MSELSNLKAPEGATKNRRRVGRGHGSNWGKTSGMGQKGQKCRQGKGKPRRGFEGGQMPLSRRLPKRGFFSRNRVEYAIVNVGSLADLPSGSMVDTDSLRSLGLIKKGRNLLLKVLGEGELTVNLTIRAHKFSKSATEKIQAAGGTALVLSA